MDYAKQYRDRFTKLRMSQTAQALLAAVALIAAYAIVGTLEYNDLHAAQQEIKVCRVQS